MSFFGRAANLVKGGIKSLTGPGDAGSSDARARALDQELARTAGRTPERAPPATERTSPPPAAPSTPAPARTAPERDEHGNVKRTL